MSDEDRKRGPRRTLRFVVTSALLVAPAAQGCGEPEPEPVYSNAPYIEPSVDTGGEGSVETDEPPAEDPPPEVRRTNAPAPPPPRPTNAPMPRVPADETPGE